MGVPEVMAGKSVRRKTSL